MFSTTKNNLSVIAIFAILVIICPVIVWVSNTTTSYNIITKFSSWSSSVAFSKDEPIAFLHMDMKRGMLLSRQICETCSISPTSHISEPTTQHDTDSQLTMIATTTTITMDIASASSIVSVSSISTNPSTNPEATNKFATSVPSSETSVQASIISTFHPLTAIEYSSTTAPLSSDEEVSPLTTPNNPNTTASTLNDKGKGVPVIVQLLGLIGIFLLFIGLPYWRWVRRMRAWAGRVADGTDSPVGQEMVVQANGEIKMVPIYMSRDD